MLIEFFDSNNNLEIIESHSLNKIYINNKSYKYKGELVNQGPNFNTLQFYFSYVKLWPAKPAITLLWPFKPTITKF